MPLYSILPTPGARVASRIVLRRCAQTREVLHAIDGTPRDIPMYLIAEVKPILGRLGYSLIETSKEEPVTEISTIYDKEEAS